MLEYSATPRSEEIFFFCLWLYFSCCTTLFLARDSHELTEWISCQKTWSGNQNVYLLFPYFLSISLTVVLHVAHCFSHLVRIFSHCSAECPLNIFKPERVKSLFCISQRGAGSGRWRQKQTVLQNKIDTHGPQQTLSSPIWWCFLSVGGQPHIFPCFFHFHQLYFQQPKGTREKNELFCVNWDSVWNLWVQGISFSKQFWAFNLTKYCLTASSPKG